MDDEIWDEHRWESFLKENDRRVDRYMHDLQQFMRDHPQPSRTDEDAFLTWKAQLRAHMESRGWSDPDLPLGEPDATAQASEDAILSFDELLNAAKFPSSENDDEEDVNSLPVYHTAVSLAGYVLEWANKLPGDVKDSTLVQYCSQIMQIGANLAKGHGIGYEQDMIGGNIACVKRALAAANVALGLLHDMRTGPYMEPSTYVRLYEETFEVRNDVGLYVQALRERFELGID